MAIILNVGSYASAFDKLYQAIAKKDPIYLDMWTVSAANTNASIWLLYGTLVGDIAVVIPNIVNWLLCASQVITFLILQYYRTPKDT